MPPDAAVLAVEFKINLMAPAVGERLLARGRVARAGGTITVCVGDAVAVRDGIEQPVARMQGTIMTVLGREGLRG